MTPFMIAGLVILGVLFFVGLWFVGGYNNLVRLKALLDEGWSGIDVQLKRRYDLIPNLVAVVKQYSVHEKELLENVTKMRSISMGAVGINEKAAAEGQLSQALKTLFAVSENYPDLKANENFLRLQSDLGTIEDEIQLSRRYYNGTARNYNTNVASFPTSIIANFGGFSRVSYFEMNAAEREAPQVKF